MLTKLHHCMADGVSGSRLHHAIFADTPAPATVPDAAAVPGPVHLVLDALGDLVTKAAGQVGLLLDVVRSPAGLVRAAAGFAKGVAELAGAIRPAAPSSLSGPIGAARRYHVARAPLSDIVRVATARPSTTCC